MTRRRPIGSGHLAVDPRSAARINSSAAHTDFMICEPEVCVTGVKPDGS